MSFNQFIYLVSKRKGTLLSVVILFLLIAVVISAIMPYKYGAKSKLLVVQNISDNADTYLFLRTNEYLTNLLAQVVLTSSFYNETLNAGLNINKNYFTNDPSEQSKIWKKTVKASAVGDTGVINISVKHPDKYQAGEIIAAIDETLQKKNAIYHSAGDKVTIKLIDQPAVDSKPVEPNIILNIILGLSFGMILGMSYIYAFPNERKKTKLRDEARTNFNQYPPLNQYTPDQKRLVEEKMAIRQNAMWTNSPASSNLNQPPNIQPRYIPQPYANMPTEPVRQTPPQNAYQAQPPAEKNNKNINNMDYIDNIIENGSMRNIFG